MKGRSFFSRRDEGIREVRVGMDEALGPLFVLMRDEKIARPLQEVEGSQERSQETRKSPSCQQPSRDERFAPLGALGVGQGTPIGWLGGVDVVRMDSGILLESASSIGTSAHIDLVRRRRADLRITSRHSQSSTLNRLRMSRCTTNIATRWMHRLTHIT